MYRVALSLSLSLTTTTYTQHIGSLSLSLPPPIHTPCPHRISQTGALHRPIPLVMPVVSWWVERPKQCVVGVPRLMSELLSSPPPPFPTPAVQCVCRHKFLNTLGRSAHVGTGSLLTSESAWSFINDQCRRPGNKSSQTAKEILFKYCFIGEQTSKLFFIFFSEKYLLLV